MEARPSASLAWQAAIVAALIMAAMMLAVSVWADRYLPGGLLLIGLAAGGAARWSGQPGRWAAVAATVLGILIVWLLLPGLVERKGGGLAFRAHPIGMFFAAHYVGGGTWLARAAAIAAPVLAVAVAWSAARGRAAA